MYTVGPITAFTPHRMCRAHAVQVENGRIRAFAPVGDPAFSADGIAVDYQDAFLAPGFIDLQINGAFGADFTADPGTIC